MLFIKLTILFDIITAFLWVVQKIRYQSMSREEIVKRAVFGEHDKFDWLVGSFILFSILFTFISAIVAVFIFLF